LSGRHGRLPAVTAAVVIAFGVVAEWLALYRPSFAVPATAAEERLTAADFLAGAALTLGGAAVWHRRRAKVVGQLLIGGAVAWFAGSLASSGLAAAASAGAYLVALHRAPLVHAILFARGRARTAATRAAIIAAYVISSIASIGESAAGRLCLAALLVMSLASRPRRVTLVVGGTFAAALTATAAADIAGPRAAVATGIEWMYDVAIAFVGVALATALLRRRSADAAVARIVLELGDLPPADLLAQRLGRALGDPSLAVAFWSDNEQMFLDHRGSALPLPSPEDERVVTMVRDGDRTVAALVHHRATLEDPELALAAVEAVRVAVTNDRLQREIARTAGELRASRRRFLTAADRERQRLEHKLRRRTSSRLDRLEALLRGVKAEGEDARILSDSLTELADARRELEDLARGLGPSLLGERGLAVALRQLIRRSPIPTELDVSSDAYPLEVETAAYFVVAEALANVAKHAAATRARVEVVSLPATVRISVRDDGRGGASLAGGTGLRGLADRVDALGGTFSVVSESGRGTTVTAELPTAL
jgi:signal transduction histidine kinase